MPKQAMVRRSRTGAAAILLGLILALPCPSLAEETRGSAGQNLVATLLEVTQSVQTLTNSVPLIAGKSTYVRLYARAENVPLIPQVSASLIGFRHIPFFPPIPIGVLQPVNPGGRINVRLSPSRDVRDHAFLFQLPASWRSGTVELRGVVDPGNQIPESTTSDNTVSTTVTFRSNPPMRYNLFDVRYPDAGNIGFDRFMLISWVGRTYPVASHNVKLRTLSTSLDWPDDRCTCTRDTNGNCTNTGTCPNDPSRTCTADSNCGCGRLNNLLRLIRTIDLVLGFVLGGFHPDARYYGMVSDAGGFMRGCSPGAASRVASGPTGSGTWGWDTDGSYGDWYGGHELGHAFGRPHATCCGATGSASFPHAGCQVGTGASGAYGFDVGWRAVYPTPQWKDFMSYCDFQWTSDFTFTQILARLDLEAATRTERQQEPSDVLVVTGQVNLDMPSAMFDNVYHLMGQPVVTRQERGGEPQFALLLRNRNGTIVHRHFFTPDEMFDDSSLVPPELMLPPAPLAPHRIALFAEVLPFMPDVASLELISDQGEPLIVREVSANPPAVQLVSPARFGGQRNELEVVWTASDPDPDDVLTATLLYSADGGMSWTSVASELTGSSHTLDLSGLPGSDDARLRILVSDGYHTAMDTSGPLEVANAPPSVFIISPVHGSELESGSPVILEALAEDPEDGELPDEAVQWSSDLQGPLGSGLSLELEDGLVVGRHTITAEAVDSEGATGSISIEVLVSAGAEVPARLFWGLVLAALALAALTLRRLSAQGALAALRRPLSGG
jgi:hypothetical protein